MIDFRYHLVSIIAVFLALAVGLLVGSTALSGRAVEVLSAGQRAAHRELLAQEHDKADLANQVKADQAFGQAMVPLAVTHLLTGVKVVVVVAPGADSAVTTGVTTMLQQAGAQVTGQVALNPLFLNTDGPAEATLKLLAQRLALQTGVRLPAQASGPVAGQQAAARLLAASLLDGTGAQLSADDSQAILTGLSQQQYVTIVKAPSTPATLAVLVAPGGTPPQTGSQVLVATAVALRNAGTGAVMAGAVQSVGPRSVISAEEIANQVSTVDNADTVTGQIWTVQALRVLLDTDGKHVGHYGIGPQAAVSPAPTPTVPPPAGTVTSTGARK